MQPETAAVRCRYQLVRARARSLDSLRRVPPVDSEAALQTAAKVYWLSDAPHDAFTMLNRSTGHFGVVVNPNVPSTRLRWTCAHELGHIVLGHVATVNGSADPDLHRWAEREANVFAEEFLMPWLLFEGRSFGLVAPWARLFGVSCEAMSRRLVQVPQVHPVYGRPWLGLTDVQFAGLMSEAQETLKAIRAVRPEATA